VSYNGSGTFNINSAGQPVVSGTVISSTAFNALTSDLATGLTTALTKDGQSTPTANITLGGYKITNLAAGTAAADAVRFSQLQGGSTSTYITAAGADTITGTVTPTLTAYTTGQQFSFIAAGTNTTAVTLNIDGVGAKAVTRAGTTALAAGDILTGQVAIVEYDGTQFQLLDPNAFTNLRVSGTLGVTGVTTHTGATTMSAALTYGGVTLTNAVTGTGKMVLDTTPTIATPVLTNPTVTNYVETLQAIGTVGASSTLALTTGTVLTATLTASTPCTFTMPTATAGKSFILILTQAATGMTTATFTGVKWPAGTAPTITATASAVDTISFVANGTNWYGTYAQAFA
jgi:hypothetical protein